MLKFYMCHTNTFFLAKNVFPLSRKVLMIRPKMMMCDDGNYRESRYFTGWKRRKAELYTLPYLVQKKLDQVRLFCCWCWQGCLLSDRHVGDGGSGMFLRIIAP